MTLSGDAAVATYCRQWLASQLSPEAFAQQQLARNFSLCLAVLRRVGLRCSSVRELRALQEEVGGGSLLCATTDLAKPQDAESARAALEAFRLATIADRSTPPRWVRWLVCFIVFAAIGGLVYLVTR